MMTTTRIFFVDIEWMRHKKKLSCVDDIFEMGVTIVDNGRIIKKINSTISPINLKKLRLPRTTSLTVKDVSSGVNLKEFMVKLNLEDTIKNTVIVWSRDTQHIFAEACNVVKIPGKLINYIVLQEEIQKIYTDLDRYVSFENALLNAKIEYDAAKMHRASYDVECLISLYKVVRDEYTNKLLEYETDIYANNKSKILHKECCRYVTDGLEKVVLTDDLTRRVIEYRTCAMCMRDYSLLLFEKNSLNINRVIKLKKKKVKYEDIELIARYYHCQCEKGFGYVKITTKYSNWKIYIKDGLATSLYHKNYHGGDNSKGYHEHEMKSPYVYSVITYIAFHDAKPHKKKIVSERQKIMQRKIKGKKNQKKRKLYKEEDDLKLWKKGDFEW